MLREIIEISFIMAVFDNREVLSLPLAAAADSIQSSSDLPERLPLYLNIIFMIIHGLPEVQSVTDGVDIRKPTFLVARILLGLICALHFYIKVICVTLCQQCCGKSAQTDESGHKIFGILGIAHLFTKKIVRYPKRTDIFFNWVSGPHFCRV
jgi:hypothetical protein